MAGPPTQTSRPRVPSDHLSDPRDSDVGKGVRETSDDHPRQFALTNKGIRFWSLWSVDRLTDKGETTFRPRNEGEESSRSDCMVLHTIRRDPDDSKRGTQP